MERVLQQQDLSEIDRLFDKAYQLDAPVVFYPVRHHSPACAYHLQETIRSYSPEAILIEGPSDADHLMPFLTDSASVPPLCIYYSYNDREGRVSEEKEKYRAYYPFLSYSPEWVAVQKAKEAGIAAHFIDLPYGVRLVNRQERSKTQYSFHQNEEYEGNSYTAMLAKKAGCRSFAEFWESRFELSARTVPTREFVRSVFSLGYFMRQCEASQRGQETDEDSQESFETLETLQREWYMAGQIAQAKKQHSRILVVTGAFHVCGLLEQLEQETPIQLKPCNEKDVAAYLMPYTFAEADSRSGYEAGMMFPAYYQNVWEKMKKKKNAFEAAALEYIIQTARYARRSQPVSLPDEINAYAMARSLAQLRGKSGPGVYELLDGVRSAFVKGDSNSTATFELDFLFRLLSGMGAGTVSAAGCVPPVVQEFRALCAKYRVKIGTVEKQSYTLDIIKNPAHYEKSKFFHQLLFLETGFCSMESGPDYVNGRDKNLMREIWSCRYSTQVETRLTDLSVYGATLSQVCASLIERGFRDSMTAEELGKLLISVQVMGVEDFFQRYGEQITAVVENDRNFVSLCRLTGSLQYLGNMQKLMEGGLHQEIPILIGLAFRNAAGLMAVVRQATEEEEQGICEQLRVLYSLTLEQPGWCDTGLFEEQAEAAIEDGFCNSRFYGECLAIRYKQGALSGDSFCGRIVAYLETSLEHPEQAASFICGLFLIARDVLFTDPRVLDRLDRVIGAMDSEKFMSALPNFRYAFTSFLPAELERLGKMVAQRYRIREDALSGSMDVTDAQLKQGLLLDEWAAGQMKKWGLGG